MSGCYLIVMVIMVVQQSALIPNGVLNDVVMVIDELTSKQVVFF